MAVSSTAVSRKSPFAVQVGVFSLRLVRKASNDNRYVLVQGRAAPSGSGALGYEINP